MNTEPAGDAREIGAESTALVVEAVAREALGGREEGAAAIIVARLQPALDHRNQLIERPVLDERPLGSRRRRGNRRPPDIEDRLQPGPLGVAEVGQRIAPDVGHETAQTIAPFELPGLSKPGEIRLAKRGSPAGLQDPQGPAVLDLLL